MTVKAILLVSIQSILFKVAFTQCLGPLGPGPFCSGPLLNPGPFLGPEIYPNLPCDGYPVMGPVVSRIIGANLVMDTSSPSDISGVSIYSDDLLINGAVFVAGNLPFTGTVALEGIVPAAGTSVVSYECGNGNIGMIGEIPANIAVLPAVGQGWIGMGGIPNPLNTGFGIL